MEQPSNQGDGTASVLRSDAQQLGSTAANRLHSEVDARKTTAAAQAQSVSSAITQVADGLDESSPEWLKSAFRQGAQQIQRFADSIEQRDSRELMRDAQEFARNSPGTFLAACAGVGFAAARVLKAGGAQHRGQRATQDAQADEDRQFGGTQSFGGNQTFATRTEASSAASDPIHRSALEGGRTDTLGEFV